MQITPNFSLEEFSCHDPKRTPYPLKWVDGRLWYLCKALERIRDEADSPIIVVSGYRTPEWNAKQKGSAKRSTHMSGLAADIKCIKLSPKQLHKIVLDLIEQKTIDDGGVGLYETHLHYDLSTPRRWGPKKDKT